ncbi:phenylacetaldoxime dehydratase family protein [Pararoseomonas sp. SCSIO 73927]|uniref:phenylacetaldoxime dehydratase family protein n=1 Tax=Pararoseomonas sp. SCSIO 73927 TaxID=3114537 RepID=UPI0030CDC863
MHPEEPPAPAGPGPRADWEPPYPAHSSRFGSEVRDPVISYVACQSRSEDALREATNLLEQFLGRAEGPDFHERSAFRDEHGFVNEVFACYWLDRDRYDAWTTASGFAVWLHHPDRLASEVGVWQETILVSLDRLETIAGRPDYGIARAAANPGETTRAHAYFGSMRHRIGAAARAPLDTPLDTPLPHRPAAAGRPTHGFLLRVRPPANMAVIRSGQDWTAVGGDELRTYLDEVHPRLLEGMAFLRDQPAATGCLSCRFMTERGPDGGEASRSSGLAMFLSLRHLEEWSRGHPTHLAIFNSFWAMVRKHWDGRNLRLWHEVCVLREDNPDFVYVNCHEATGLLRWF